MKNYLLAIILLVFAATGCKLFDSLNSGETNTSQANTESNTNQSNAGSNTNQTNTASNTDQTNTNVSSPPKNTDTSPQKTAAFTPSGNPRDDVINTSKRFMTHKNFQSVIEGNGTQNYHMEIEYVSPNRYHIYNGKTTEAIIIGRDTYVKDGRSWRKSPEDMTATIAKLRAAFNEKELNRLSDIEYVGEDTVNGKGAYVYRYRYSGKETAPYTTKLWVGKDDGLPLKIEVEYQRGAMKRSKTIYTYDPSVKIEAPI